MSNSDELLSSLNADLVEKVRDDFSNLQMKVMFMYWDLFGVLELILFEFM